MLGRCTTYWSFVKIDPVLVEGVGCREEMFLDFSFEPFEIGRFTLAWKVREQRGCERSIRSRFRLVRGRSKSRFVGLEEKIIRGDVSLPLGELRDLGVGC